MITTTSDQVLQLAVSLDRITSWMRRHGPPTELSMTARTTLSRLGEQGPTRIGDLAREEGVSQPAMTGLVSRLDALGLTEREADPEDGRVSRAVLTASGRELLADRQQQRARLLAEQLEQLDPADQRALLVALPALRRLTQTIS